MRREEKKKGRPFPYYPTPVEKEKRGGPEEEGEEMEAWRCLLPPKEKEKGREEKRAGRRKEETARIFTSSLMRRPDLKEREKRGKGNGEKEEEKKRKRGLKDLLLTPAQLLLPFCGGKKEIGDSEKRRGEEGE